MEVLCKNIDELKDNAKKDANPITKSTVKYSKL